MKKLLTGLALAGLAFGCKSTADVSDSSTPASAEAECAEKADCSANTECTGEMKAECSEGKVCPITGAKIEN